MIGPSIEYFDRNSLVEKAENPGIKENRESGIELPDDSGERDYIDELPDDSGDKMPQKEISDFVEKYVDIEKENVDDPELKKSAEPQDKTFNNVEERIPSGSLKQNYASDFRRTSELLPSFSERPMNLLTIEEKIKIKEETGWSDEIVDAIGSMKEYEIYKNASLQEVEVNGKKCLVRSDIDINQKDADGITNAERMKRGLPPLTKEGKPVELHHIGQHSDSPLAELTLDEHRGVGNDAILHNKTKESEIDRTHFSNERREHWKARSSTY